MEPQIGIRGRSRRGTLDDMATKTFQWSPRLVSGEGLRPAARLDGRSDVSMEPQIGIRGRRGAPFNKAGSRVVSMEPQIGIRGRFGARHCEGADWWRVSMEPQIGIRGRVQALPPAAPAGE